MGNHSKCFRCGELNEFCACATPAPASAGQAGQVAMTADELAALRRFYECAADGEGYDVPKPMMRRLSEIGVVQRISGAYYHTTEYGLAVLDSTERASAPAEHKPRSEKQIVWETESLAAALAQMDGFAITTGTWRDSPSPTAQQYWKRACMAQELLMKTDPNDAVANLDEGE